MSASASPLLTQVTSPHLHIAGEVCPWCEQPIPHDKFAEISARISEREGAHFAEMAVALKEHHARDKEALELKLKEDLDRARLEVQHAADAAVQVKLSEATRERAASEAELQAKIAKAEENGAGLRAQLQQVVQENTAALKRMRQAGVEREAAIREETRATTEAAMHDKVMVAEQAKVTAEAQLATQTAEAEQRVHNLQQEREALKRSTAEREAVIRQEAHAAAEAAMQEKLAAAEQATTAAEVELQAKVTAVEQQIQQLQENHELDANRRLLEQREALEQDKTAAVNAEKAKAFEVNLKLSETVQQLQRKLENKTADELGEGAEVNLYEELKGAFEGDKIRRVEKGTPGADIVHEVLHNGKLCGQIVYNSKNRSAWRKDYVTKLRQEQLAQRAEHAILSSSVFPSRTRQLAVQDGVIIANPARVVVLAELLRDHIVQCHSLRISNQEQTQKTAALYAFITSDRCRQLLDAIETHKNKVLEIEVAEQRTHNLTWERRGKLLRSIIKVRVDLCGEIERIIGTADESGLAP